MAILTTYPNIVDPFKQQSHSGLDFAYGGGNVRSGNQVFTVEADTITLTDNEKNYIELSPLNGDVSVNTIGFSDDAIPLYEVDTDTGFIVDIIDRRCFFTMSGAAGGGKQSTIQEVITNLSAETRATGAIAFNCLPQSGAEIKVIMLKVTVIPVNGPPDGFIFKLFSNESDRDLDENPVYHLDTFIDNEYEPGDAVRDPNQGFMEILYFIDEDASPVPTSGTFWYSIYNSDESVTSSFAVDIDYKIII